jgi:hypothetical protein
MKITPEIIEKARAKTKEFAEQGNLLLKGWEGFKQHFIGDYASESQLSDMRFAYYSGAHHLFACINMILSSPGEVNADEKRQLDNVEKEIQEFQKELFAMMAATIALKEMPETGVKH